MLTKKKILLAIALLSQPVYAEDLVNGIDFDKVRWDILCANVAPIEFDQNGLFCEVSHPASKFHNSKVHGIIIKKVPRINNCPSLEVEFQTLITPTTTASENEQENKTWGLCRSVFKSSLLDRTLHPERYQHSTEDWKNAHFNEETMEN